MLSFCYCCPFLSLHSWLWLPPFTNSRDHSWHRDRKEGMLEDLGEMESVGVSGNNQYANHLTILKQCNRNMSSSKCFPFLATYGRQHKRILFKVSREPGRTPGSLCPHAHTLVSGPLACHFSGEQGSRLPAIGNGHHSVYTVKIAASKKKLWKKLVLWTGIKNRGRRLINGQK